MEFLKPELLIMVPFLIGIGELVKKKVNKVMVPFIILSISMCFASVYGLITSPYNGWKYWVDALVLSGVLHGAVAAFCAMGLYDTFKNGAKKYESVQKV